HEHHKPRDVLAGPGEDRQVIPELLLGKDGAQRAPEPARGLAAHDRLHRMRRRCQVPGDVLIRGSRAPGGVLRPRSPLSRRAPTQAPATPPAPRPPPPRPARPRRSRAPRPAPSPSDGPTPARPPRPGPWAPGPRAG